MPSDCLTCGAPGCANRCVCPECGWGPDCHADDCSTMEPDEVRFLHTGREPEATFGDDPFEGLDLDSSYGTVDVGDHAARRDADEAADRIMARRLEDGWY